MRIVLYSRVKYIKCKIMRIEFSSTIAPILVGLILCSSCQDKSNDHKNSRLGAVSVHFTVDERAMPYFKEGLLLLHSFEYEDAREAFLMAQKLDRHCMMAYWGEAMTYNHSLWRGQNYDKGQAAIEKFRSINKRKLKHDFSELEEDLFQSVEILYGDGNKYERDAKYAEFMDRLYKKHPDSHEVAAFYALSLLGSVPVGRDEEIYEKGATVAKGILEENPDHPGALHYLIHSYDDPDHAHLALQAANNYSQVAPDAGHALHMPSHIYVALGMWDEVISSNVASWEASLKRKERKGLSDNDLNYHAYHWLSYGYLQKDEVDKSADMVLQMTEFTKDKPSRGARAYLVDMKATFLVATDMWMNPISNIDINTEGLNISAQALYDFTKGYKAYITEDKEKLDSVLLTMVYKRQNAETIITNEGVPMCSGGLSGAQANRLDVEQAEVLEMELRGLRSWINRDTSQTEDWLQRSADLESTLSYSYGPPVIAKPASELYGEWLLEVGRYQDAILQFDITLERTPKRLRTLKKKLEAAMEMGNESLVAEMEVMIGDNPIQF
jgi:tetratricopeptide (TPR) repeat protein